MARRVALVTGAGGEVGHLLIPQLVERGFDVVALDLVALPAALQKRCAETVEASVLDDNVLGDLFRRCSPSHVFHLAAVLSKKAEADPDLAHRVNVQGTYGLLRLAVQASDGGVPVRFVFPSSIAVYGFPDAATKNAHGAVRETEWTTPGGIYGCNKLYCELLGSYLTARGRSKGIDFRAVRYPGLISADTLPTGGTTDYAPEMVHAAAQDREYACFVAEGSRLPFMTMPDAVAALLRLSEADAARLSTRVYNVQGFSATAGEIREAVLTHFAGARLGFEPVAERQALIDSWPGAIDDRLARTDWGFSPRHGLTEALAEYMIPALRARYVDANP